MDGVRHFDFTITSEICPDHVPGTGWKKDSNVYAIRSAHRDDARTTSGIANAYGAGSGSVAQMNLGDRPCKPGILIGPDFECSPDLVLDAHPVRTTKQF